jgi:hypothetical protein
VPLGKLEATYEPDLEASLGQSEESTARSLATRSFGGNLLNIWIDFIVPQALGFPFEVAQCF